MTVVSVCCDAPVKTAGVGTTHHYQCLGCGNACDVIEIEQRVSRAETLDKLRRLNELERVLPIFRSALERIRELPHLRDLREGVPAHAIARQALREADQPEGPLDRVFTEARDGR